MADQQPDLEKANDDNLKVDAQDAVNIEAEEDVIDEIGEQMNKRLERKLDTFIIPMFGVSIIAISRWIASLILQILFLLAYLDRGNL